MYDLVDLISKWSFRFVVLALCYGLLTQAGLTLGQFISMFVSLF